MNQHVATASQEQRKAQRFPSRVKYRCRIKRATEEGAWVATVRDVSVDGIGLTVNRAFRPGMTLTIELPTHPAKVGQPVLVEVRHVRGLGHKGTGHRILWALGGAFARPLTHEELEFLRDRAPVILRVHGGERRVQVRHTTRLKSACPITRAAEEGPWFASLRNISERGLGLITTRPFKRTALLTIELPDRNGTLGKPRLLCIRHVHRQPGSSWWVVGGSLLTRLTPQEMQELL